MTTYPEYQHITNTQGMIDASPIQIRNMNIWSNSLYNQTVFTGATSTYYDAYHDQHFPLYDARTNDYEYTRRINLAYGGQVSRNVSYAGQLLQANGAVQEGMNAWYDLRDILSRFPNLWIQGFRYYSTGTFLIDTYMYNKDVEYNLPGSYWVTYILGNSYPYNMNNVDYLPFHDANDTTDVIVQQIKPFGRVSDEIRFSFSEWINFNNMPLLVPMAFIAFNDQLMPPIPVVIDDTGNDNNTIPPVDNNGDPVIIDDQGNTTPIDNNNNDNSGNQNGYIPPVDSGSNTQNGNNNANNNTNSISNQNDSGTVSQNVNYYPVQQCTPQRRGLYYEEDYYNKDADGSVLSLRRILAMFNW